MLDKLLPPITDIQQNIAYQILHNLLLQAAEAPESNKQAQSDIIFALQSIGKGKHYIKISGDNDNSILWGHPDSPDDSTTHIRYTQKEDSLHIDYGDHANVHIFILPTKEKGAQVISIHNAHYHAHGASRPDIIIGTPRKTCSDVPTLHPGYVTATPVEVEYPYPRRI